MVATMGKLICEQTVDGEDVLRSITTAAGVAPSLVKTIPGVGKPFWYWPTIPSGTVIGCDFTEAPIASSVASENAAAISAITKTPEEVLIYAPE